MPVHDHEQHPREGGDQHRIGEQASQADGVAQQPQPEGELQQVLGDQQHHRQRQGVLAEGENRQRQAQIAAVVEHRGADIDRRVAPGRPDPAPGQQSRAEHDHRRADRRDHEIVAAGRAFGERVEDQRRREDDDVQAIGVAQIGRALAPVGVGQRDDAEHRHRDL